MGDNIEDRRAVAEARLREAWNAGRLDPGEHERRVTAVRRATTLDDIDFAERGEIADRAPAAVLASPPLSPLGEGIGSASGVLEKSEAVSGGDVARPSTATRLVTAAPILAMIVFFIIGFGLQGWEYAWVAFLFVPLAHVLAGDEED